jgi:PAS domain S-box-containing protein
MSLDCDQEMEKRVAAEVQRRLAAWKRSEKALAGREREHRSLAESSPEVIARFDRQLRHAFINEYGARVYGMPKEEVIGRTHAELGIPAEIAALWRHHLEEVLASRREQKVDFELDSPDFGRQCFSALLLPEVDEQGEVTSILTIARDITVLRRAEAELKESEERYRSIFEQAAVGIVYAGLDGRFLRANSKMFEITGYTESELAALTFQDITHPDDLQADLDHLRRLAAGEIPSFGMEKRYRRKDGSVVWVHLTGSAVRDKTGKPRYYVGMIKDIGDRKLAEQALRESERRFKNTFENAAVGMAHVGLDGRFIRFNGSLCRITGYSAEELTGLTFQEITHPDDLEADLAQARALLDGEATSYSMEKRYIRKDGSLVWINLTGSLQRDDQGSPEYFIGVVEDISERRGAEEALRVSEETMEAFFDLSPGILNIFDQHLRYIKSDRLTPTYFGLDRHSIVGKSVAELNPSFVDNFLGPMGVQVIETGKPQLNLEVPGPVPMRRNEIGYWLVSFFPVPLPEGKRGLGVMGVDITERKQVEEELRRTVKELARSNRELEQFAYITSHDLQTPLRAITGFLDLLARRYKGKLGPDADEFISFAVGGAEKMHQLINDILTFSRVGTRGKPFARQESGEALAEALDNLQAEIKASRAEVSQGELPLVTGDRNQLVQLFQHLVGNALKYRKADVPLRIHIAAEEKEGGWEFRVTDNGIGIAPRYAERIFQIFQRLHTVGEYPGTGIGLAICRKIVERHGGRIWVESEPGEGATFYFTLPKT